MELLPGKPLIDQWDGPSKVEREKVIQTVKQALSTLRQSQQTAVSGLRNGPLFQYCLPQNRGYDDDYDCIGPFNSIAAFHCFLVERLAKKKKHGNDFKHQHDLDEKFTDSRWCSETTCFTHGDLHPSNILLDDNGSCSIIDWESAGWWPKHMEYYFYNRYTHTYWNKMTGVKVNDLVSLNPEELAMVKEFSANLPSD